MTIKKRIRNWRWAAEILQAVLILGIPFLRIGGESALRFDIPTLRLHFFGTTLLMDEFFIVLAGIIFVTFLIILVTQLFGRIWCGWVCPQTVIIDLTRFLDRARGKSLLNRSVSYLATLLICSVVGANLIWYFVSPYEFIPALMNGALGSTVWAFWISLTIILFLDYGFLRHTWCATACPYAKLQGAFFDSNTMVIAFDQGRQDECMDCRACVKVCPVHIDIRKGLSSACINCAECIDACADKLGKKQRTGLVNYFFGQPGEKRKILRTNTVLTGSITFLSLIFFIWLAASRSPLNMTVLPNNEFVPRMSQQGELMSSYILAIENKSRSDGTFSIISELNGNRLQVQPGNITLKAGEYRRVMVILLSRQGETGNAVIELVSEQPENRYRISGSATISSPMGTK